MDFLSALLNHFNLDEDGYRHLTRELSYADLPPQEAFADIEAITARISRAINKRDKIIVYGDYDADGVLATSILVDAFKKLDYEVGYYVPNRYQDGYGLSVDKVIEISQKGYRLIITVDNGINAFEAIKKAYELGIEVIITDHHEILADIPQNAGVLHPFIQENPFPMCGAMMAFMLSRALLNKVDEYHLSLAAIATIADMMPLREVNRDIVRLGLTLINQNKYPQLFLLADSDIVDEATIGMKIAPSINAIGRLVENHTINRLVKYFTATDSGEINLLANWIIETNASRKQLMNTAIEALPQIEEGAKAIVYLSNEKEGLLGLLANRLMNNYDVPTLVLTPNSANVTELVGSARTPLGHDLIGAFNELSHLMIRGGGHANAGGLTLSVDQYESFKQAFIKYFTNHAKETPTTPIITMSIQDLNWDNYAILQSFAPFGQDFKAPKFAIQHLKTSELRFIKGDRYLATNLSLDSKLLSFQISKELVDNHQFIDISGYIKAQSYRGKKELVFMATGFEPSR
jgi:single-stranded-DNA-specific exonuclease